MILFKELYDLFKEYAATRDRHYFKRSLKADNIAALIHGLLANQWDQNPATDLRTIPTEIERKIFLLILTNISSDQLKKSRREADQLLRHVVEKMCGLENAAIWQILLQADLLTEERFRALTAHPKKKSLLAILKKIRDWDLLDKEILDKIIEHPDIDDLALGTKYLQEVRQSENSPVNYFPRKFERPSNFFMNTLIASVLVTMVAFSLLVALTSIVFSVLGPLAGVATWFAGKKIRKAYLEYKHPRAATLKAMLQNTKPSQLIESFDQLKLWEDNKKARSYLQNSDSPLVMSYLLRSIKESNISEVYRARFITEFTRREPTGVGEEPRIERFRKYFLILGLSAPMGQAYTVFKRNEFEFAMDYVNVITHPKFQRLLTREEAFMSYERRYVKNLIETIWHEPGEHSELQKIRKIVRMIEDRAIMQRRLENNPQSTHEKSMHAAASRSAKKLFEAYGDELTTENIDFIKKQITEWVNKLSGEDLKTKAIKTQINNMLNHAYAATYIDPASGVSLQHLFYISWLAVHDESRYQNTTLTDALENWASIFYEIRRGGNINEAEHDDGQQHDKQICPPGAFNKIIERLYRVGHDLVEFVYVTKQELLLQVKKSVKQHLLDWYKAQIHCLDSHEAAKKMLDDFFEQDEIAADLWTKLLPKVAEDISLQFGSSFDESILKTSIESGKYFSCNQQDEADFVALLDQLPPPQKPTRTISFAGVQQSFWHNKPNSAELHQDLQSTLKPST